jgi:hypothetical protein
MYSSIRIKKKTLKELKQIRKKLEKQLKTEQSLNDTIQELIKAKKGE